MNSYLVCFLVTYFTKLLTFMIQYYMIKICKILIYIFMST